MIIISNYELRPIEESIYEVKSNEDMAACPCCGSVLHYRDQRLRIRIKEGGEKQYLKIRRLRCSNPDCLKYHNELPDCLVPYKHYEAEVISGVLDGIIQQEDLDAEDYPCFYTMIRWLAWLQFNISIIEDYVRRFLFTKTVDQRIRHSSESPILQELQNKSQCWMETVIRLIYNHGGFLYSFY